VDPTADLDKVVKSKINEIETTQHNNKGLWQYKQCMEIHKLQFCSELLYADMPEMAK